MINGQTKKLSDLISEKRGVTDFTCEGECSKCGACCSALLPLTPKEIKDLKRLAKTVKLNKQPIVVTSIDLTCPFLTNDNRCSIYSQRPIICRLFQCNKKVTESDIKKMRDCIPVNLRQIIG